MPSTSKAGVRRGPRGRGRPRDREVAGEVVGEQVVVDLGDGDDGVVQGAGVHRPPPPVGALDLVRDDDVGVQVRVPGAGVPVVERRRDHPPGRDLGAGAGARCG